MKIVKGFHRKILAFFLLTSVIAASIPLGSTYATATSDLPESENPYHIEIVPDAGNTYEGDTQAGFDIKVSYSGVDAVQKETVHLETVISDAVTASLNAEVLSEERLNPLELTADLEWEESYRLVLPKLEIKTDADYMVMLKDGEDNILASANQKFTVEKLEADPAAPPLEDATAETASLESGEKLTAYSLRNYTDITGILPNKISGLDKLYYGSVGNDPTAPFHDADALKDILENGDEAYARAVWRKYQYDLYDPNYSSRGGCGPLLTPSGGKYSENKPSQNPEDRPDYADELLASTGHEYPKDGDSPFHANIRPQIDAVKEGTIVNGALVENDESVFEDLEKTASPDTGDANTNREYTVDLKAAPNLKQIKPTVLLFQIQTSWQMFDLLHANDRASLVNGNEVSAELLSLYEMKQAFFDFMDWMEENTDGSLMIGITNFQHGGTHSLVDRPYFTNETNSMLEGLYGWDSFGDCEHIHYANTALANAMKELNIASNFSNWVDNRGTSIYDNAEMVSVIVGGACEAADLKEGSTSLPEISGVLKRQYGIRTNKGTGAVSNDMISWMDYAAQGGKKGSPAFDTGAYYKDVVTREGFFNTLKSIYADVQTKAPNIQKVTNVTVEDTITDEFDVKTSEIKAFVGDKDVTSQVAVTAEKQEDGTTKVTCDFGTVENEKEVHLQIPVQAKSGFIGSNNVYTNTGEPTVSYNGRIDSNKTYTQKFEDTPAVNVPVKFGIADGQTVSIEPGESVDLADLAKDTNGNSLITKAMEESLGKYAQTEGTVIYQWVDSKGQPVGDPTTAAIDSNSHTPPVIPSYVVTGTEQDIGSDLTYKLQVTFIPAEVKDETTSKNPVSRQTQTGKAVIQIAQTQAGKVYIRKSIDNYDASLRDDEFMVKINSISGTAVSSQVVLKHDDTSGYIEITEPTVLNIEEILPMEYSFVKISIEDSTGAPASDIQGSRIEVDRGENITITVHNKYTWNPFFHTFDSIMNVFEHK
ncbi:hypothetical protein [Hespellia stercorisuis]|uniref:Uncharacterized protein n=1 Tax=Hespellia stercorisuis DSM 15480 TaxID=1121950 RepID=A0A1M6I8Z3_9FIRM|nr:hypothetical protein [Hespellia stercorisuis]SHJ30892.1 hypothetical protein SAMN02745243_00277 [Hespellia stercorisuis DSM 15480]